MKRGVLFATIGMISLISGIGCHSSESTVPPPTTDSLAAERRRIESDPNMPAMAKQAALTNLSRREQELKK